MFISCQYSILMLFYANSQDFIAIIHLFLTNSSRNSLGFNLWGPWHRFVTNHPTAVQICKSGPNWWSNQPVPLLSLDTPSQTIVFATSPKIIPHPSMYWPSIWSNPPLSYDQLWYLYFSSVHCVSGLPLHYSKISQNAERHDWSQNHWFYFILRKILWMGLNKA